MLASIVSIQRSNVVFVVLLFLQIFFSSTRVQKEGAVDPNTVLSPNFAKIKGISSVLCAAYWWSLKAVYLGISPLPRHTCSQPRTRLLHRFVLPARSPHVTPVCVVDALCHAQKCLPGVPSSALSTACVVLLSMCTCKWITAMVCVWFGVNAKEKWKLAWHF